MISRTDFKNWSLAWGGILFGLYLTLLVVLFGTSMNPADPDLWQRFAVVEYLFTTGHFPAGDTFSYLGLHEVRPDHEYGSGIILHAVYQWGGGTGIVLLKLVTLGVTLALTVRAGLGKRAPTMLDAFFYCLVLLALLSSFLSTLRSEASTHVLFALWVLWFQQERRGVKISALAYGLTMALWCNLHGGFIIGLAWLGLIGVIEFFTGGDWKRRVGIWILCLVATLANPFGYKVWEGVYGVLFIPRADFEEWAPVTWFSHFDQLSGYKILVLWSVIVVVNHIRKLGWRKCDRASVILLGCILIPSMEHARQTSIFAIAAGGLLPSLFVPEISLHAIQEWKPWLHRFVVRGALVILPLIFACRLLPTNEGFHLSYPPDSCPIKAVDYLQANGVKGNLLVGFNSGSYALWKLRGQMLVSLDGRYEVAYSYATFKSVQDFFKGNDGWRETLNHPLPDAILVNLPDGVYARLLAEPGWKQVYVDSTQAVFRPSGATDGTLTAKPVDFQYELIDAANTGNAVALQKLFGQAGEYDEIGSKTTLAVLKLLGSECR